MSQNLIQFAPIFDAVGAKINLSTKDLDATVVGYPKNKKDVITSALDDVDKFMDTRSFQDGVAIFAIADFIDGEPNPLSTDSRNNIMEGLGLKKDGRYVSQIIALQRINKSWHVSETANSCSYFGDTCVKRGVTDVSGKRGRKSNRQPDEYHERKSNGLVTREQLTTPALEALWRAVSPEAVVSATKNKTVFSLEEIGNLDPEILKQFLSKINEALA